jgi:hypothetical protein
MGHSVEIVYNDVMEPPRFVLSDPAWLTGSAPNGSLYRFTVGMDYASFTATSQCVLGDQSELSKLEPPRIDKDTG